MRNAQPVTELSAPDKRNYISPECHKAANILLRLYNGQSLNRFEAERIGDHCLPSTISALANGYGLSFHRQRESVPNRFGRLTSVVRYNLLDGSKNAAYALLVRWGAIPGGGA